MDSLYVNDNQLAARLGIPKTEIRAMVTVLERSGFPKPDPQFNNLRYWPAIRAWLDRRNGIVKNAPTGGPRTWEENFDD